MTDVTKTNTSGLTSAFDPTKYPVYDRSAQEQQEGIEANEKLIKALEDRYAQPNLFKVAAGFLKPQLGGFGASLGSASEALGENVEQQRAMAVPIAEMRAKLAQSKAIFGQNVKAANMLQEHEAKKAPLHELPDLVAKLTQLDSPLAAGPKARLDEARKSQQTMIDRANLIRASNEQELARINAALANKEISISEATQRRNALPKIPEVPDLFATPKKEGEVGMSSSATIQNPAGTAAAPMNQANVAPPTQPEPKPAQRTYIKPVLDLNDEVGDTAATISARANKANDYSKQGDEVYNYLRAHAGPENYNDNVLPIENALHLMGYGEKDPAKKADLEAKAKKVMNVLSGDTFNAFLKSVDTGVGGKVGDLYAQINLPVETFVRSKFPPELQDYALDLAQNLAQAAIIRQKLGGVNANQARNAELHLFGTASPSMNSTPFSAMKSLMHLHTSIDQLKDMHNFIDQVDTGQHPKYEVDPKNKVTRIFDIVRSQGYKDIAAEYLRQQRAIDAAAHARDKK